VDYFSAGRDASRNAAIEYTGPGPNQDTTRPTAIWRSLETRTSRKQHDVRHSNSTQQEETVREIGRGVSGLIQNGGISWEFGALIVGRLSTKRAPREGGAIKGSYDADFRGIGAGLKCAGLPRAFA
jgi:hypothetical protein